MLEDVTQQAGIGGRDDRMIFLEQSEVAVGVVVVADDGHLGAFDRFGAELPAGVLCFLQRCIEQAPRDASRDVPLVNEE